METSPRVRVADVDIEGGHPALDLVDTIGGIEVEDPAPEEDFFRTYEDLVDLGVKTETFSEAAARRLRRAARERPEEARAAWARARDVRALFEDVFRPFAEERRPPERSLEELTALGAEALTHGRLVESGGGGYRWSWDDSPRLDAPLWPLVHSAVELVTHGPLDRVSHCKRCRLLFLDTTKNHSRRWCSMEGCGTDAKKERYVARRRERRAK